MAQESTEKSGESGCLIAIAIIAIIGAAVYFAYYRDAQFPGSETVSNLTRNTLEAIGEDTTPNTNSPEIQGKPPEERHRELKKFMLQLTNQHRAAAGAPPVRLGMNPAAQIHAEEALKGCYSAHWDRSGMKPNHRYTLTGGTGADAENGSGLDFCIKTGQNYAGHGPMEKEVAETVQGWMDSPGHRRSLLDPAHTIMNAGIAHDRFNTNMVQHFSSDYVQYQVRPNLDPKGILRLSGQVSGATLEIGDSVNIQVGWDPPLKPLNRGQLANTYALCNSRQVGYIVEPLPRGWFHNDPEVQTDSQEHHCVDPYMTSPSQPAPASHNEAHQAWANAKQASEKAPPITVRTRRITAEHMEISKNRFAVRTDLTPILQENGPGIYTITLWGRPLHMSEPTPLSEQSIFWQTEPPVDSPYQGNWNPAPDEIKQAKAMPTEPAPPALQISTPAPTINLLQAPTTAPPASPFRTKTPDPSIPSFLEATTIPPLNAPRATKPAPEPREFQAATPTPIPPNIHSGTVGQYSYSLEFPRGWIPTTDQDGHAIFKNPEGTRGAEIRVQNSGGTGTAQLLEERNMELLDRIRAARKGLDVFEMKQNRPPPKDVTEELGQAWMMEYRWRESPSQCIRDVVDIISPSNRFDHSILISTWVCEESANQEAETEMQKILESFQGWILP